MLLFLFRVSIIAYFSGFTKILKRYLSVSYLEANESEQALFESLLTENDQQLFLWFTGREVVSQQYFDLVEKLRR